MHGLGGQQNGEVHHQLLLGADRPQIKLTAAGNHIVQHGVECKLILAGPPRYQLPDLSPVSPDEFPLTTPT